MALPVLFSEIRIGSLTARNRVFLAPHSTHWVNRLESARLREYYRARAAGGVGLIVHEGVIVHPSSRSRPMKIWGWDDENIEPYRTTTEAVHAEGARIVCQMIHNGQQMDSHYSGMPLWAPSQSRAVGATETTHSMTIDEIRDVVDGFARTAAICKQGQFDGVEIHGANGYLVQQFLSPANNHRSDVYGGSQENRNRFALEIIDAVRDACGSDFVVGIRLSGDELHPGGLSVDRMCDVASALVAHGGIDYISVTAGNHRTYDRVVPDMSQDWGLNVPLAAAIKKVAATTPVLVAGRIADPNHAEQIVASGQADMVGMARALIADPDWANKAEADRAETIRPCTFGNECRAAIGAHRPLVCMVNPTAGREFESASSATSPEARRVVVVGGGVAGLQATTTAAERGHSVVLLERSDALGGQIRLASAVASRQRLAVLVDFLEQNATRAGVTIERGVSATVETVCALRPDHVILATGARAVHDSAVTGDGVVTTWEVLSGTAVGSRVVVFDEAGSNDWAFCGTVEHLAALGHAVVAVTSSSTLGAAVDRASLPPFYRRIFGRNVEVRTFTKVTAFRERRVETMHVHGGIAMPIDDVDAVVVDPPTRSDDSLAHALRHRGIAADTVGDALAPRRILDAMREAHSAASRL